VKQNLRDREPARPEEESAPRYLRAKDLQRRWRLSAAAVYKLLQDGKISSFRIGSAVRVPLAVVEKFERDNSSAMP
jgi:hypothetical protein